MNYTEKEKKGLDKVESMNKFFDKILMPAIGVLIILTLLSFIVGSLMDKFSGIDNDGKSSSAASVASDKISAIFKLRAVVLDGYAEHIEEFKAYGYNWADGYSQDIALCKTVDEELVIYQFSDGTLGDFTILRYTPLDASDAKFDSVSLTVSSDTLINVTVNSGESQIVVTFTSSDFSTYSKDDNEKYSEIIKLISIDELNAMYEIFETDIKNLAKSCGISI